jgi:predicted Zn-dependent protease
LRLDSTNTTAYFQLSKVFGQMQRVAYAEWALAEYYALLGRREALKHAQRALKGLPNGSPEKIRTTDILQIARAGQADR